MLQYLFNISLATWILVPLASFIVYNVFTVIFDPLRSIPGPFPARFTRLWYLLALYKGDYEITNIELHRKYGAIVRIAPNQYSIDDVDSARTIYGHGSAFAKSDWYKAWGSPDPEKATLFSDVNAARHAVQRRKYAAAYSMSSLITYERFVDNCSKLMVQRFSELAASGKSFDLAHWLQCYAFDVIGEITFGNRFGFLDMGLDEAGVFAAIDAANAYSTYMGLFPQLYKWIFPLLSTTGGGIAFLAAFNNAQVSNRLNALKDARTKIRAGPPDFLTRFLTAHEENPQKMTRSDLVTISHSNIRAGSDTTGVTLSGIFYHLLKNPATFQRLRKEIDDAATAGKVSDPISFKEAQELPYLQAVIKEGLRIHSAVGLALWRVVPESATIAGQSIPAKSTVGINAWVAHRNRSVYGQDADIWRPERWLEIEKEGRGGEVDKYFFAFGMGSRTCIGKNISLLEISKLVPTLVRTFDFQLHERLVGEERSWKTLNRWFVKQVDLETRVSLRKVE